MYFRVASVIRWLVVSTALTASLLLSGIGQIGGSAEAAYSQGTNGRIAFRGWEDRVQGIFAMDPDGSDIARVTSGADDHANYSPDGALIVFDRSEGGQDIWSTEADRIITPTNLTSMMGPKFKESFPSWSPTGHKIIFQAEQRGQSDIWTINADGSEPTRLTSSREDDTQPAWSPSGDRIAYVSRRDGQSDIYTMTLSGEAGGVTRLTNNAIVEFYPDWSPDGTRILFGRENHIWAMNSDGSQLTRLTTGTSSNGGGNWSPDGTQIVFNSFRDGFPNRLFTMSSLGEEAGGKAALLTAHNSGAWWADWQRVSPQPPCVLPVCI